MADNFFGALGTIASDELYNANRQAALNAEKTRGEIASQPIQDMLRIAQTAETNSAAETRQEALRQSKAFELKMASIAAGADKETFTHSSPEVAEVLNDMASRTQNNTFKSQDDYTEYAATKLIEAGYFKQGQALQEELSQKRLREAQQKSAEATQQQQLERTRAEQVKLAANGATFLLEPNATQEQYNQWRAQLAQLPSVGGKRWIDASRLPENLRDARPVLELLSREGLSVDDQLRAKRAAEKAADDKKTSAQSRATSAQQLVTSRERAKVYKEQAVKYRKEGAIDKASRYQAAARKTSAQTDEILTKLYPELPADALKNPDKLIKGQVYQSGGNFGRWTGTGITPIPRKRIVEQNLGKLGADDDADDDEGED